MQSDQNEDGSAAETTYSQQINYPLWISVMPQENALQGITEYWPVAMNETENTQPILFTSPLSWEIEPDNLSKEKLFETNPFVIEKTKFTQSKSTRSAALCSKDKKITVIPDQYFANSLMLGYTGGEYGDYRNLDFLVNHFLKMNNENELAKIYEHSVLSKNSALYKTYNSELFNSAKNRTIFCIFIFVPLLIITAEICFKISKKRFLKELPNEK